MKLHIAAVVAALLSVNAVAEINEAQMAEIESDCQKFAQEDGVAPEEMEAYLDQCIQDYVVNQSADSNESAEVETKE